MMPSPRKVVMLPPLRWMMGTASRWYSPSKAISACGASKLASRVNPRISTNMAAASSWRPWPGCRISSAATMVAATSGAKKRASCEAAACPATERCSNERERAAEIASKTVTATMEMILSSSPPISMCSDVM